MTRLLLGAGSRLTTALAGPVGAEKRPPLPALGPLSLEGTPAPPLPRQGRWLLVYVKPDSSP